MSGLQVERRGGEVWWTLNRPDVRNALDDALIATMRDEARALARDETVRVLVLAGAGASFCAGADLAWMRRMRDYDEQRNLDDALAVADLFHAIASLPMPVVARVHGAALGGGAGLLAVSDIVIAADDTQVGFTEARVGILPATIAPYVIRRIGIAAARTLFLRAHRMPAADAHRLGLIDEICPSRGSRRGGPSSAWTRSRSGRPPRIGRPRRCSRNSRRCRARPSDVSRPKPSPGSV